MYLRLRKRKKPLPNDPTDRAAADGSGKPATGPGEPPASPSSDWAPADADEETPGAGHGTNTPRHPHRGSQR